MPFTRSTEGLSAPLASLYTVFFGGISIIRLSSYRHKALRYLLGRGILQIVVSAMPERTYWNKHYYCADPICALEQVMGIEPTSSALVTIVGLKPTFHFCVFYYTKPWEGRGISHYTIPAFHWSFLFLTYIL